MTESALGKALDEAYNRFKIAEAMEIAMENSMKERSWEYNPEEMGIIRKLPPTPTDILKRLDKMESKLEELERKIADTDKINETEEQPQPIDMHKVIRNIPMIGFKGNLIPVAMRLNAIRDAIPNNGEISIFEIEFIRDEINKMIIYSYDFPFKLEWKRFSITEETEDKEIMPQPDEINDPISRFKPY